MRLAPLFALALLAAPALADSPGAKPEKPAERQVPPGQEPGLYRFGATFRFTPAASASACQSSCASEGQCFAWSYVQASGESAARCELKRGGGRVEPNPLATSGISPRHEALYATRIALPSGNLDGGPDSPPQPSAKPVPVPVLGDKPVVAYDAVPVVTRTYTRTTVTPGAAPRYPHPAPAPVPPPAPAPMAAPAPAPEPMPAPPPAPAADDPNQPVSVSPYYPDAEEKRRGSATGYFPQHPDFVDGNRR